MKFHQVPVGQRFEFEGEWYVKTRPLTAVQETSGQERLIRRSAAVTLPGESRPAATESAPQQHGLPVDTVLAAFELFHAQCLVCLEDMAAQGGEGMDTARERIEAARDEFLDSLSLR